MHMLWMGHAWFIYGLCIFLVGGIVWGFTFNYYRDWDVVEATYQEANCVKRVHRSGGGKNTVVTLVKYCDLTISYEFRGKKYVIKEKNAHGTRYQRLLVHPSDPLHYDHNTSVYIVACILMFLGVVVIGVGIFRKDR